MRILKSNPYLSLFNTFLVDSPLPANINYFYNFGSLLGLVLVIQLLTGIFLALHYCPNVDLAFNSVEHIMREVNYGWLIRYAHSNGASFFFLCVYIHIARGLYYGSFNKPRVELWSIGVTIFIALMATAFLGYVLPWGQMSFWAACVITNFFSAVPYIGTDLVEFIFPFTILSILFITSILPTFGLIHPRALRKVKLRTQNDKLYALNIPFNFRAKLPRVSGALVRLC